MSKSHISAKLRQQVAEQSRYMCCYCQSQQRLIGINLTVEHIIPESLGGSTTIDNLCLACWDCNLIKGSRIAAIYCILAVSGLKLVGIRHRFKKFQQSQ